MAVHWDHLGHYVREQHAAKGINMSLATQSGFFIGDNDFKIALLTITAL
jgi:hypothetical protein